ncbi:Uncharacterized conserved protein YlxW, UPF0749 family [Streptomyces sp. WMMB 714]|uniref:DUF881 domain-containing protein n=1 Tax=Streptomyces sp. WMMB 714 TaxID=1286822 RepID=UPI000823DB91|nr:DUF881 domain-containing protein [Streptomyces sp. WMMB 714]SCK52468.1 Uncharacterized conserved protein YlxW, UPF0749 family [Streptomyces sp. WMMB 714]
MSDEDDKKRPGQLPPEEPTGGEGSGDAREHSGRPLRPEGDSGAEPGPEQRQAQDAPSSPADGAEKAREPEGGGQGRPAGPDTSRAGQDAQETPEEPKSGEPQAAPAPGAEAPRTGRQRLAQAVWPPRVTRAQLIVALLLFVLGLGLAIQVRSTSENSSLRGARQEDLVRILDELDDRTKRLEDEKQNLEGQRTELENSSDQAEEARKQTRQKARQLGVLAGTVGAQGPGIELTVTDPGKAVEADMLLDAVQELRAAGAEAIEINNVRVVASTYFSDSPGGVRVDGRKISEPYRFQVIGKPQDLEPALNIPGGVVQTLRKEQADVSVRASKKIVVDALRSAKRPDYARSSSP